MPNAPRGEVLGRRAEDSLEDRHVLDRLVGRQDDHDLVVGAVDDQRRERDRGRGVATERLEDERRVRDLVADQPLVAPVGDHRDVVGQALEALDRALEQRPFAEQRQEGLRALGAAEGMEAGPTAAGQDDGVHARLVYGRRGQPADLGSGLRNSVGSGRTGP